MKRKTLGWSTLLLAALALPLTAPTCSSGGGGLHAFSANSIIIPMDACYQRDTGTTLPGYCVGTAQSGDDGILKAYGLVYFLVKHGIAVYWVIDPNKTAVTGVDMTLVDSVEPVTHYNWAGATTSFMGGAKQIDYRGGPFVVDGVDHDTVINLLQNDPDFAQFKTAKHVDLHVANSAFQAPVAKALAGLPPTLALLNITGGADQQNSLGVLTDYLTLAGLNFSGASGTAAGPTHGAIYDTLATSDFLSNLPDGGSLLQANGYKLLWVPHWEGPNSYLVGGNGTQITSAQLTQILTNIGAFADRGGNVFAECAGIGTIEGAYSWNNNTVTGAYGAGASASDSLSTGANLGLRINSPGSPISSPYTFNFPASPFSQIGDFPLAAISGAINDYAVRTNGSYVSYAQRMIVQSDSSDLFTVIPNKGNVATAGTVVYMGGHEYSATAGVRLVLNTLFNLSATCVSPNTPCNTGKPGACAAGKLQCDSTGNVVCNQVVQPTAETCNDIDDDCDGLIDNLPPQTCYDGPAAAVYPDAGGIGPCRPGTKSCVAGAFGPCVGEVLPTSEVCNGIDDDCNGSIDLLPDGGPISSACYDGPLGTENVGVCKDGSQICDPATGTFGACTGEQVPQPAQCNDGGLDYNCDGSPDACQCNSGDTQPCYDGPTGTLLPDGGPIGICHAGTMTCTNGLWGTCVGEQGPEPEQCDGTNTDYNCNGIPGDGCVACNNGDTRTCYDGPAGSLLPDGGANGSCHAGIQVCNNNLWGTCQQEVTPGQELCDGQDNDCNGQTDDNAVCPPTQACINGTCVPATCTGELATCAEGFTCDNGTCELGTCGDGGACPLGQRCHAGSCVDPCASVTCGAGATCSGGACVAGGCYDSACVTGQVCVNGACVNDPCANVVCPTGDFCRQGYCVPSCVFTHCQGNQVCNSDGTCGAAPCNGACGSGSCLGDGGCGADVCAGVGCASGQSCQDVNGTATCVADPCAGVTCPVGFCNEGQCQRTNPDAGASSSTSSTSATGSATNGNTGTTGNAATTGGSTGANAAGSTGGGTNGAAASGGAAAGGSTGSTSGGTKSGCGCGAGGDVSPIWLSLGLLVFLRRRRSAARTVALVAMVGGAAALSACSGGGKVSSGGSSGSTSSTTVGTTAGSGSNTTGSSTGHTTTGGTSTTGSNGTTGSGCPTGQAMCSGSCVDVLSSNSHCGSCTNRCAPDETCDDGFCAPTSPVNPALYTVSPTQGTPGSTVVLVVTGDRIDPAGELHFTGGGVVDEVLATTVSDPQDASATITLNLDDGGPMLAGPAEIRVVNPGRVISNPVTFTIGGSTAPTLISLNPNSAPPGADVNVDATGTLFNSTTALHASGPGVSDLVLATTFVSDTEVTAIFPLADPDGGGRGLIPGAYTFVAVNGGASPSNGLPFTVTSEVPVLNSVSPSSAAIGAQVALTATGEEFDPSTVLHFQQTDGGGDVALTTNFVRVDTVLVPASNPLDLSGLTPGVYQVLAANQSGQKLSSPVPFTINSNAPHVTTVNPNSGLQAHTVPVTVTGSGFDPTSVIHFLQGSGDVAEATTYVSATQLTCTIDLTSAPAGTAEVAVFNSGNLASNTVRFTVLSNVAVLTSLSSAGAGQGTTLALTLTGTNFEQGAIVNIAGQSQNHNITPDTITATEIDISGVDLSSYNTGAYAITVVNPSAQPSAGLTFTVEPGTPTLTGISPNPVKMNTVQTFTLTGTLFAQGATVHVTATGVDASYNATVNSPTSATISNLSLANVPAGQYTVTVVNPGPHASGSVALHVEWPDGGG